MIIPAANRLNQISEYYFSKKLEEIRKLRLSGRDIINLGIGSPDMVPSKQTIDATIEALKSEKNHGYASYKGTPELRQAIAKWYQRVFQIKLDANSQILPLLGSKEGILYTSLAFLNPGDHVLIPDPSYPTYTSAAHISGATPLFYDITGETDWLPDFDMLNGMDLSKVKLMWVNYPHMPTGKPGDKNLFKNLVAFAKQHRILICNDNPYSLVLNKDPLSLLEFDPDLDVSLELNSLSKAFNMAGWRVGMCVGREDYINTILQVKSNADTGMFLALQAGATVALENSDQWHSERNAKYARRQKLGFEIMDALKFTYDPNQVGMFIWAKAPEDVKDVTAFLDKVLDEANVFITPGFVFGKNGQRYGRVSLCAEESVLDQAAKRIRAALK